jgi:hypothetical protein
LNGRPNPLRHDRRGTVGFAVVAVALLVVGSAAALYLHSVDYPQAGRAAKDADQVAALRAEARRVAESLSSVVGDSLDRELAGGLEAAARTGLAGIRQAVTARLVSGAGQLYPRVGAAGSVIDVTVTKLSVSTENGWAEVPSVYGGHTPEEVPVWLAATGIAQVSFSRPGEPDHTEVVAFAGRSQVPVALPLTLAARAAPELLPGGLAERFASQAAQHVLPTANVTSFDRRLAPEAVRAAVMATLMWAFGTSGDGAFDEAAVRIAGEDGLLRAGDLYNRSRLDDEAVDVSGAGRAHAIEGTRDATVRILNFSDAALEVSVTRRAFSGQELGAGIWQAVEVAVRGEVTFTVEVSNQRGSVRVGPLHLPVEFDARAAAGPMDPRLMITPEEQDAIETQARTCGVACEVAVWLAKHGLSMNSTTNMSAALRGALFDYAVEQAVRTLPPVEDANRFAEAYGPPRRSFNPLTVSIVNPPVADGARAVLTLDGAPAGSATVVGGQVTLARVPDGEHTVGLSVPCGDSLCAGGVPVKSYAGAGPAEVSLAPAPSGAFLASVTRRQVEERVTLGEAALREAEDLLGIERGSGGGDNGGRTGEALTRADVFLSSATLTHSFRNAVDDAKGFLKVSMLVLKATDAARKVAGGPAAPVATAGGEAALLVLAPETRLLLVATIHGTEIARAAFANGSIELSSPWTDNGRTLSLDFRLEQVGLVATAALAGLTLGADVVRVQREREEGDSGGLAVAFGKFAVHGADAVRQLSLGLMKVADRFFATARVEATAPAFAKASVVLGALMFALEVADLYHDAGGNLTLMVGGLVHPASVAGLLTLPSLAQSAASTAAGALLILTGQSLAAAGPIGIAAGLFVLAGVILLNGQTFASAAFGTLDPGERVAFESAMGNRTRDLAKLLAFSNRANPDGADAAARTAALASARLGLLAQTARTTTEWQRFAMGRDGAREEALRLSGRASAERQLRHAAIAAVEQMDDFAGGNHTRDPGRLTEGYGELRKVDLNAGATGRYPYGGDLVVQDVSSLPTHTLTRAQWRALLPTLQTPDLAHTTFGYVLTATDGIPTNEAERFVVVCRAAGALINEVLEDYQALSA